MKTLIGLICMGLFIVVAFMAVAYCTAFCLVCFVHSVFWLVEKITGIRFG